MRFCKALLSLVIISSFCFSCGHMLLAQQPKTQDKASAEDKVIAALFKTLATVYVKAADIDKLKEKQIRELNNISEEDFRVKYERVFRVLRDSPVLETKFGLPDNISKEQLTARIKSFDRSQMCNIINSIPDEVIAGQLRAYIAEHQDKISKEGITQQVTAVWGRIKAKAERR